MYLVKWITGIKSFVCNSCIKPHHLSKEYSTGYSTDNLYQNYKFGKIVCSKCGEPYSLDTEPQETPFLDRAKKRQILPVKEVE